MKIFVRLTVIELLIKRTIICTFWSITHENLAYWNFNAIFEFFRQFALRCLYYFSKQVFIIYKTCSNVHKTCSNLVQVQFLLDSYSNVSLFSSLPDRSISQCIPRMKPLHKLKKKKINFKSVSHSWHMILLVVWNRSAWAFYGWVVVWNLKGSTAAHCSVLKKMLSVPVWIQLMT